MVPLARPASSVRAPGGDRARQQTDARWLFGLFSALFAMALILDQLWWGGFDVRSAHALVVLAALWVLLRPTSVIRFAVMTAVKVVSVALDLPFVGSHRLLELITGAGVISFLLWTTLRERHVPTPGALFEGIAPFLRASMIVVYAFAALAKMNTAFFNPAISCASSMSRQIVWFYPSLLDGRWQVEPAIWGTVLIEVALPVLLALPWTRLLAVALGVSFHTVLALAGNVPFTAVAFAFYVAFLPKDTPERVRQLFSERPGVTLWASRTRPTNGAQILVLAVLVGAWLVGATLGPVNHEPGLLGTPSASVSAVIGSGTRLVVVMVALSGAILVVMSRRAAPHPSPHPTRSLRIGHPILVVGLLMLTVNGVCPYLGLKTETSFEMFSGLRTEPGAWNNVVVPEAVRVFSYQDQRVRVVASNDPGLVARTSGGTRLVRFEMERYLRSHPGTVATYTTGGEQGSRTLGPLAPGSPFAERVVVFRDVVPPGRSRC
ncbi:MAG: HTTM domain-containing protein [Actinomycetota bacterium]|nr:HTTM domain-containing protein [Actinomycetota bacterium]